MSLHGRDSECETLRNLISTVRSSNSRVLVLRGEAGVGKTVLLQYVSGHAAGFRCVQVAGVESDMELAFAGLQQLCAPLLTHLDELPQPQREALNVAFGRAGGPAPDRFLVGLAVLSLMAAAADDKPLLCIVDDAQWLDQVSIQTLAFVARRLLAEPVALIFAARPSAAGDLAGLPEMAIGGLSYRDARDLLDSVLLGAIDPRVRDRVIAETRGIPLAILKVPRSVPATELAGGYWISGKQTSTATIEEEFLRRIRSLPGPTQRLLLLAAAEPVGDTALFLRAAAELSIPVDAIAPAEAAGLIEFGPRLRFGHPLMRSAAYRAAELSDRRTVHRALAAVADAESDPDRRAWHAANAAGGPDETVASMLEGLGRPGAEQGRGCGGGVLLGARNHPHGGPRAPRRQSDRRRPGKTRRGGTRGRLRPSRDGRTGSPVPSTARAHRAHAGTDGVRSQPKRRGRCRHVGRSSCVVARRRRGTRRSR